MMIFPSLIETPAAIPAADIKPFPVPDTPSERTARLALDVLFDRLGFSRGATWSSDEGLWFSSWGAVDAAGPVVWIEYAVDGTATAYDGPDGPVIAKGHGLAPIVPALIQHCAGRAMSDALAVLAGKQVEPPRAEHEVAPYEH